LFLWSSGQRWESDIKILGSSPVAGNIFLITHVDWLTDGENCGPQVPRRHGFEVDCLTDWLTNVDWLTGWLTDVDWLTDWLTNVDWLTDWLTDVDKLTDWLTNGNWLTD
jgi:hypothetical protein